MQLLPKIAVGFLALASLENTVADSLASSEFRNLLTSTDCTFVIADRGLYLKVMGWAFPIPKGHDFYGYEYHGLIFRNNSDLDIGKYLEEHPGTSIADAVRKKSDEEAYITYYNPEQEDDPDEETYEEFEAIDWRGLTLWFRSSVGGRQVETTVYQVIVGSEDYVNQLRISSTSLEQITNIISCANKR